MELDTKTKLGESWVHELPVCLLTTVEFGQTYWELGAVKNQYLQASGTAPFFNHF